MCVWRTQFTATAAMLKSYLCALPRQFCIRIKWWYGRWRVCMGGGGVVGTDKNKRRDATAVAGGERVL